MSLYWLELRNSNEAMDLLEGDEVLVNSEQIPAANGKDLALFEIAGEKFISRFTRYGNQIMLLNKHIQVVREHQVNILGTVIAATNEKRAIVAPITL